MITVLWPLLIMVLGLVIWYVASNGKVQETGKLLFFVGAFWVTYVLTGRTFKLG